MKLACKSNELFKDCTQKEYFATSLANGYFVLFPRMHHSTLQQMWSLGACASILEMLRRL